MMQYVQFRLGLISDYVRLSLAEFKLKMYHYLHRPWYMKQSTIYHSWQKPLRFVQSIVYGVLMSFVSNKHITIFTDNDMYHANVATLGNRSPILNEHIDTSLIVRVLKYDVFNCLANQRSFIFRVSYCIWALYNISDKSC